MNNGEFVTIDFWESLADLSWNERVWDDAYGDAGTLDLSGKIVFCGTDEIPNLFSWLKSCGVKQRFILVSGCSDAGIHLQEEAHPNADLYKATKRIDYEGVARDRTAYHQFALETIKPGSICSLRDKYIVKMDSYTYGTFNEVPSCVAHWFTCNLNVKIPGVTFIPFGVNSEGHGKDILLSYARKPEFKKRSLYINVQDNSLERYDLKQYFRKYQYELTAKHPNDSYKSKLEFTLRPECNLRIEDFYRELSDHLFVACPAGNGLDCYRTYETLLVGSIPVLKKSVFATHLRECSFPVYVTEDFRRLTNNELALAHEIIKQTNVDLTRLTKKYWQDRIKTAQFNLQNLKYQPI